MRRISAVASLAVAAPLALSAAPPFAVRREGLNINAFVQDGPVAAHVVLRSGRDPRLLVAFPAGNSGVALWFDRTASDAAWTLATPPRPVSDRDARGRPLNGVTFAATIRAPRLTIRRAVLSSVRVLRDYEGLRTVPAGIDAAAERIGDTIVWQRDRLDGAPGYRLSVRVVGGATDGRAITADGNGTIRLAVTALTGEAPLTSYTSAALLGPDAAPDPAAREALRFLSYHDKFLAGSWRFQTYFGRDTLMSLRLLMPALTAQAVDGGLRSVLARLAPDGNVAHEEDIGEYAVLDHRKAGEGLSDAPVYDYRMIDSAFMLAPVARAWLLDDARGRARAATFLSSSVGGATAGARLIANLRFVAARAAPFAADPRVARLIALRPEMQAGEWRDSNDGLGGGRYPYDVNAVLVPAALDAGMALARAGLLDRYANAGDRRMLASLPALAAAWRQKAPPLFAMTEPAAAARDAITAYAGAAGVPAAPALASVTGPVRYTAIALDGGGRPVPVQHSDDGFAMLFETPDAAALDIAAGTIARPFPAGLMTGAGMLVANPVFASPAVKARFGPEAYHGTVIWSWQQALAAAGLARQIARSDLPPATCATLRRAEAALWTAIRATRGVGNSELWSWRYAGGGYRVEPFGASGGDADESNAAQLWSTVYLAVRPPAARGGGCRG